MSNLISHCSLNYHDLPLNEVENFALGVKAGYYGNNPPFDVLTLTEVAFTALITDYVNKRGAYVSGGLAQKGPFLIAKTALMDGLDFLAGEVDKKALGNKDIIILAGFVPTDTTNSSNVKPGQGTVTIKRGIAGELIATCSLVPGAKHYGCIMVEGGQLPNFITINADGMVVVQRTDPPQNFNGDDSKITGVWVDLTDQRVKHFTGLKHDAIYYFYFYAVNATGVGPFSEVVSMVCW